MHCMFQSHCTFAVHCSNCRSDLLLRNEHVKCCQISLFLFHGGHILTPLSVSWAAILQKWRISSVLQQSTTSCFELLMWIHYAMMLGKPSTLYWRLQPGYHPEIPPPTWMGDILTLRRVILCERLQHWALDSRISTLQYREYHCVPILRSISFHLYSSSWVSIVCSKTFSYGSFPYLLSTSATWSLIWSSTKQT